MSAVVKRKFSFGSLTLLVGGLALAGLLFWGWRSGEALPLWPALLVVAVNLVGALQLVLKTRAKRAEQARAARSVRPGA